MKKVTRTSRPSFDTTRQAKTDQSTSGLIITLPDMLGPELVRLPVFWRRNRPETFVALDDEAVRSRTPPEDLPPAIAGAIIHCGTEPAWSNALATLFDLARRGVVSIEESPDRTWYRSHELIIRLQSQPAGLRPHERGLLEILFQTKKEMLSGIKASEVSIRLWFRWNRFSEPLKQEMQAAGLLDAEKQRMRRNLANFPAFALVAAIIGVIGLFFVAESSQGWLLFVPLGLSLVSGVALVVAGALSPLSKVGAQAAERCEGFYLHLRDVALGREPVLQASLLERYLPYAVSYGLAEGWVELFKKQSAADIPAWFQSLAAADGRVDSFAV